MASVASELEYNKENASIDSVDVPVSAIALNTSKVVSSAKKKIEKKTIEAVCKSDNLQSQVQMLQKK
eukprot:CAMPEP_0170456236 /NCGR_PEP_ID=MMETSP0123-20130129/3941_1 /TAXON_ID=182087 /ORGANISM="Favella ehrenbergii, Strain Fehren 1" /LENGTH=66 /DNA_ID=CAMNT_0010719653 /DNA_START=1127 /DNA_END=1327 /DNA_ORIENTATION=+